MGAQRTSRDVRKEADLGLPLRHTCATGPALPGAALLSWDGTHAYVVALTAAELPDYSWALPTADFAAAPRYAEDVGIVQIPNGPIEVFASDGERPLISER